MQSNGYKIATEKRIATIEEQVKDARLERDELKGDIKGVHDTIRNFRDNHFAHHVSEFQAFRIKVYVGVVGILVMLVGILAELATR